MNIFVVDEDPCRAAEALCDKHVGKMLMESCQLLYTTLWHSLHIRTKKAYEAMDEREQEKVQRMLFQSLPADMRPYWPTHVNHPCAVWLRESAANYTWLADHALALADQFRQRRGKEHTCEKHALWLSRAIDNGCIKEGWEYFHSRCLTPFAQAMHESCLRPGDAVAAYRDYYNRFKAGIAAWNWGVSAPVWWNPQPVENHTT